MTRLTATGRGVSKRGTSVAFLGTMLEFYDFFIFGAAGATVFPELFFPSFGKTGSVVLTMVAYGIGYADRPLGAFLFRRFGRGRSDAQLLVVATVFVGVATTAIGVLPTHAAVGGLAGVLLVLMRAAQGIGLGGEWGRATLAMVDRADTTHRGFPASVVQLASPCGLLAGNAVFAIAAAAAPGAAYLDWGWRLPFLLSGVLVTIVLLIRLRLLRTMADAADLPAVDLFGFCRLHWRQLLIAVGVRTGSDAAFYVMALYILGYVTRHLGLPRTVGFTAVIVGAVAEIVGIPLFAIVATRVHRKWIVAFGAATSAGWIFAYFGLVDTRVPLLVYLASAVGVFLNSAMWSPARVFIPELFPPGVRHAGTGLGFQLAAILGGGITPVVSVVLLARFGTATAVASYLAVILVISAVAAVMARTTARRQPAAPWSQ
jgi:MFS family permease